MTNFSKRTPITPDFFYVENELVINYKVLSVTFDNVGNANATINGTVLASGKSVSFNSGENRYYTENTFTINGTDTTILVVLNK